jgi:hypothetical protein
MLVNRARRSAELVFLVPTSVIAASKLFVRLYNFTTTEQVLLMLAQWGRSKQQLSSPRSTWSVNCNLLNQKNVTPMRAAPLWQPMRRTLSLSAPVPDASEEEQYLVQHQLIYVDFEPTGSLGITFDWVQLTSEGSSDRTSSVNNGNAKYAAGQAAGALRIVAFPVLPEIGAQQLSKLAELQLGDVLTAANGTSLADLSFEQAVAAVAAAGANGSRRRLAFERLSLDPALPNSSVISAVSTNGSSRKRSSKAAAAQAEQQQQQNADALAAPLQITARTTARNTARSTGRKSSIIIISNSQVTVNYD